MVKTASDLSEQEFDPDEDETGQAPDQDRFGKLKKGAQDAARDQVKKKLQQAAIKRGVTTSVSALLGSSCLVILSVVVIVAVVIVLAIVIFTFISGDKSESERKSGIVFGNYAMPLDAKYYRADSTPHTHHDYAALDISAPEGAPIYAVTNGVVTSVEKNCKIEGNFRVCGGYWGNHIYILGDDGMYYMNAHMAYGSIPKEITLGSRVAAGQQIGGVGGTGNTFGSGPLGSAIHLHFEINCSSNTPVPCPPAGHGGRTLFPTYEHSPSGSPHTHSYAHCSANADATGPYKFIEAIMNKQELTDATAPWALYGGCPHTE